MWVCLSTPAKINQLEVKAMLAAECLKLWHSLLQQHMSLCLHIWWTEKQYNMVTDPDSLQKSTLKRLLCRKNFSQVAHLPKCLYELISVNCYTCALWFGEIPQSFLQLCKWFSILSWTSQCMPLLPVSDVELLCSIKCFICDWKLILRKYDYIYVSGVTPNFH